MKKTLFDTLREILPWLLFMGLAALMSMGCIWWGPHGRGYVGVPVGGAIIIEGGDGDGGPRHDRGDRGERGERRYDRR
jgi:hypothetical protein